MKQLLIVNPTEQLLSDLITPQSHQDSFPFQRFPRVGLSRDQPSKSNTRNRSITNPQPTTSSPLSKSTSSLSNLDPDLGGADDQSDSRRRDLTQSLSSLPSRDYSNLESKPSHQPSAKSFGKHSIFGGEPLNLTRLGVLSNDEEILKASKELILIEETKEKERIRWKNLEINVISAQRLDLEDERLKGYDGVILDMRWASELHSKLAFLFLDDDRNESISMLINLSSLLTIPSLSQFQRNDVFSFGLYASSQTLPDKVQAFNSTLPGPFSTNKNNQTWNHKKRICNRMVINRNSRGLLHFHFKLKYNKFDLYLHSTHLLQGSRSSFSDGLLFHQGYQNGKTYFWQFGHQRQK